MPTKRLPARPNLDHLKAQAKDLLKGHAARAPETLQRLREFHPRFASLADTTIANSKLTLSDAQLAVAHEYGYATWTSLKRKADDASGAAGVEKDKPHHERIADPLFFRAVELLDAGDRTGLDALLQQHPSLVRQRVSFEGENYFRHPTLLEFTAENPVRHGSLPSNVVDLAALILRHGAKDDAVALNATLALVASGRVARECGVQIPLIDLLCGAGADSNGAKPAALGHGEFDAVEALLRHGAKMDLPTMAGLGRSTEAGRLFAASSDVERHRAVALAAQYGRTDILQMLLDAGEDPNRFNPVGMHSHSTPLHQAAFHGHETTVRLLLQYGAALEVRDIIYHTTPLEWARHAGQEAIAELLQAHPAKP
jgi:hypothetical protein